MILNHLTPQQGEKRRSFRSYVERALMPHAHRFDTEQAISREVVSSLAGQGYIGASVPEALGGRGLAPVDYGLLSEELGRACQSIRNFVAVQDMVVHSIEKWGTAPQKERWLPSIIAGETVAAFALTEPHVGSDAAAVETIAIEADKEYVLNGTKKWISFAQLADLFLVFAQLDGRHTAFLLERDTEGLRVEPIDGLLGLRGSMLGRLRLEDCRVPAENLVGGPGLGLAFVASSALDLGRYSTAWGSVGLSQACLDACVEYCGRRTQYGTEIKNHQLVQRMLADMITDITAARLLCHHAGVSKDKADMNAANHTLMAKYRASTVAVRVASDAVQIHGAQGIGAESSVQRHYRDAKVMEIIEGTTQIQQTLIGQFAVSAARSAPPLSV
ncbi:acyl-CoA dehydrogenase family protein [Streptomyces sp. S.PNR 29]|uniref:acyl-CoA dehydrogenase family protein n=1 Tax=Streptomyces sp. S.PNR 29 TaxID=2973805 RepID=UPI0025B11A8D|nr:acyl-CoA dehydrogenase family protein [Streptomyces sp. S.PNR 29]MDN0197609.1 acyl-CoA dehydrogenase family protein [Streptomyces sp. S.PNR 29]